LVSDPPNAAGAKAYKTSPQREEPRRWAEDFPEQHSHHFFFREFA
jgi:hypothetical protein